MSEAKQLKRELKLVTPDVELDVRAADKAIKSELLAALIPVLKRYGMDLVKAQHSALSDEFSMHIRASVPDGLNQDCFTRDLLCYSQIFGFQSSLLGRSIVRTDDTSGRKDRYVISGLDVVDKNNPSKCKFRVFNKADPSEVNLVDYDTVKSVFPTQFKSNQPEQE